MRYSIEPWDRIYLKDIDFYIVHSHKLVDSAKKSTTGAIKTASKRAIQKTAETTGNSVGNKIVDKIKSAAKNSH